MAGQIVASREGTDLVRFEFTRIAELGNRTVVRYGARCECGEHMDGLERSAVRAAQWSSRHRGRDQLAPLGEVCPRLRPLVAVGRALLGGAA
jgi:hypothetical protein